ncbi:autotransporter domain-containing protein [Bosea sp. OK403]|uniref:autotransporter outer membrane beta-barrel domain-containing protein n=1 Tax=Bosea sp. OK403 TaxID=1855286 RepID=UPI0015873BEC|nr:autotransporter domain-containing protein [Bosea sp. OK403]
MEYRGKARLFAGVSCAVLALACLMPASAATYSAGNQGQLDGAINAANASSDPSATILLTGSFSVNTTSLAVPTKPITIDTQGFTLFAPGSNGIAFSGAGAVRTLVGTFQGATGGSSGAALAIRAGASVTNMGLVQGGSNITGNGGPGVDFGGPGAIATLTNHGVIRGGTGIIGGLGIGARNGAGQIINTGTIEGGSGNFAIASSSATLALNIINSGTIRAGAGANAIGWLASVTPTTGSITLELQAGSVIEGNVVANATGVNDIFRLGGTGTASFDVSTIGPSAQYQNFDSFEKTGTGTWSLTGTGTATTNWTINQGTLQIGNGGTSGSIIGSITTSSTGTLAFNRSDAFTFDNLILGNGTLRQIGSGTTILTANNAAFAGTTSVEAGTLSVNGVLGGTVTVLGGRLQGNGSVGATTVAAGGTIAPGNSIGTLTVNGAYLQAAGSTYQVEIDPATVTSDLIRVNGTATLASGAAFTAVNYTGATLLAGQRYTILTSTGGLTGRYGSGDFAMTPFLSLRDSYDANNAYLTVIQSRTVASAGATGNQVAVGSGVDSLPASNPVQTGLVNQASVEGARTALDQISGEIHASAKTALIDESWLLRAAVNDRLRSAFGGVGAAPMATLNYGFTADLAPSVKGPMPTLNADRFAVWGQGYGSWGHSDSDGNAARLTRSTGGFLLGADAALFDTLRIGAVAGYSRSTFDVNSRFSSGESDNYHLGLYAGGRWGALSLRTGASYSWHNVETSRTVISSAFGSNLRAGYDAGTAQIFGELGYRVDLGKLAFEPFAGLAYVNLHTDGFSETGGSAALTARGDDTSLGYSTLGLRASTSLSLQGMELSLRGGLAWRHAFGDVDPTATLAFAGSSAFSIAGIPIARDAAVVEAGLDLAIGKSATLGLAYTGQLAQDTQDHAFKGVLAVKF